MVVFLVVLLADFPEKPDGTGARHFGRRSCRAEWPPV
jgi:hypothetical protein